ncbi:MAG: FmdB family zinc ribbon protein [Solirubrobacterales bacterium]
MPIYEYRCRNGHEFEIVQSMSEDPVSRCRECDAPVERVFHPVAVHFKGSGFYSTDYARGRSDGKGSTETKKDADKQKSGDSKSDKKDSGGEKAKAGSGGD